MHNFVDLLYAYCMPLKSISTRKTCLLLSIPVSTPPPLFAYLTLHLPFTEDSALLPGSGKNLGPVDPIIMSNDWCGGPTELVRSSSLIRGVHMGARVLQDIHIIDMVWLYRSPKPVERRGVFYLFNWLLPAFVVLKNLSDIFVHPQGCKFRKCSICKVI